MTLKFTSQSVLVAIVLVCVCFASAPLYAQVLVPKLQWQRCYGGSDVENHPQFVEAHDHMMIHTADGGYAFVAGAASEDGPVFNVHQDTSGNPSVDIWLVKLDAQSNIQWSKCFGGTGTDAPTCLIQTSDGGYAICGKTRSHDGDVIDADSAGSHSDIYYADDAWIVKTDASGNKEWAHAFGWSKGDEVFNQIIEVKGGYIAVGVSTTIQGAPEGNFHNVNTNLGDLWILKMNTDGVEQWRRLYGKSYYDAAAAVLPMQEGRCLIAGTLGRPGIQFYAAWVLCVDSTGQIIWQRQYGDWDTQLLPKSMIAVDGAFAIVGRDVAPLSATRTPCGFILKIDSMGNQLNMKEFSSTYVSAINSIIRASDGNLVFAGSTKSPEVAGYHLPIFRNISNVDSTDAWVGCLSPDLDLLWQHCYGGDDLDEFYTVLENSDHSYSCYGSAEAGALNVESNGDISGIHGYTDAWIVNVKLVERGIAQSENSIASAVYPNPAVESVSLRLDDVALLRDLRLFDALGNEIHSHYEMSGSTATIDLRSLPTGIFTLKATYANGTSQVRRFVHAAN